MDWRVYGHLHIEWQRMYSITIVGFSACVPVSMRVKELECHYLCCVSNMFSITSIYNVV